MADKDQKDRAIDTAFVSIPLARLEMNEGQIEGLPANPRNITEAKMERLKKDIQEYPEMLKLRGLLVYPLGDKYVIIGGNMRYSAMQELGFTTAPCIVIPNDATVEQLKAYTILDNAPFGKWDWDMLANEWEASQLTDWGVDLPIMESEDIDVPSVLDKEDVGKPFTVKMTFENETSLNAFREQYEEQIKADYNVTISVSGGGL